jgi:mycoredoxin
MVGARRAFPFRTDPATDDPQREGARTPMAGTVTMYSTTWCGYCRRLKGQMDREGIGYSEVNIELDPESAAFVESVNGGNQVVPTVLFADGTALTNPSLAQVKAKIGA